MGPNDAGPGRAGPAPGSSSGRDERALAGPGRSVSGVHEPSTAEKGGAGFEGITLLLCENPLSPIDAAIEAADRRERFADQVETERESIECADRTLSELVDRLGPTGLAASDRRWFHDRVDDLVTRRQDRLRSRSAARQDGHDLCGYVYAEEAWTYPVLTAVARLRNSVE